MVQFRLEKVFFFVLLFNFSILDFSIALEAFEDQAGVELTEICLCLLIADIKSMHHHYLAEKVLCNIHIIYSNQILHI